MLTTHTESSNGKAARTPLRRMLLAYVLPVSLLLTSSLTAQRFLSLSAGETISSAMAPQEVAAYAAQAGVDPGTERAIREMHRKAALETIERLEMEARLKHGEIKVAPTDLKRLRHALQWEGVSLPSSSE
jgi:uncharacterized protein YbjT (DUF2867 family)